MINGATKSCVWETNLCATEESQEKCQEEYSHLEKTKTVKIIN